MSASVPSLGSLRLADYSDLERLGIVASAGFYYSPVSPFERPDRDFYPNDTVASYGDTLLDYALQPDRGLLIAEDRYNSNESEKLYPALKKVYHAPDNVRNGDKIPVGFLCFTLQKGSSRVGGFQPEGAGDKPSRNGSDHLSRDVSDEGMKLVSDAVAPMEEKYFGGNLTLDLLAVHPYYWNRGHGTSLVEWLVKLASLDRTPVGVAAVEKSLHILERAGFAQKQAVTVPGYERHPANLTFYIYVLPAAEEAGQTEYSQGEQKSYVDQIPLMGYFKSWFRRS